MRTTAGRREDRRGGDAGPIETIEGVLERVTFQNAESHFTVAKLRIEPPAGGVFAKGSPVKPGELATIVGTLVAVEVGVTLRCTGRWESKDQWGPQFRITGFTALTPRTALGIERYLGSGLVPGVGPALAKRIVAAFGERTLSVIEDDPERLREVDGIGRKRSTLLTAAWKEHRAVRDVMVFLQGHGVGASHAARIFKTYGEKAVQKVAENPYRLADDVWGIGFATADRIAQSLGLPQDSPKRADAGVRFVLARAAEEGHVCLPRKSLVEEAAKALEMDPAAVDAAVTRQTAQGAIVEERRPAKAIDAEPYSWGRDLHAAEAALAEGLRALRDAPRGLPPIKTDAAIDWVEKRRGVALGRSQREALRLVLESKVAVVTGGPGVGKTTITASLLDIVLAKGAKVRLAAPTGRAAKRMEEATGRDALTIHRLLKWNPRKGEFEHNRENPLTDCDLIVLDEASMIDLPLMRSVVDALPRAAHLVVVGDQDQLPSVGPGSVLGDMVGSRAIPVARLTEIFRQAAASRIITGAHAINAGELPELPTLEEGGDFHWVPAETPERALSLVTELVSQVLPRRFGLDPIREIQVLAPMHRGAAGVSTLNAELQKALSRTRGGDGGPSVERFGRTIRAGDKVLQLKNDYDKEVYNGDVGVVREVDQEAHAIEVVFDGGAGAADRRVRYGFNELDELDLAYCCSIHKSQGSEYPCVVIPLVTQHFMMLQRNLLYTAITRGKRRVVLVGQVKALQMAVRNDDRRRRMGYLAERIREG